MATLTTAERLTALEARLDQLEAAAAEAPPLGRDIDPGALVAPVLPPSADVVTLALSNEAGQHRAPEAPARQGPQPEPEQRTHRNLEPHEVGEILNAR